MKHRHFTAQLDEAKVLAAIRTADPKTTGEIRVFISRHHVADALDHAEQQFIRLGMFKTRHRNAVLIFLAPKSQTFALFGDVAVHQKCGPEFWHAVRDEMTTHLKAGQYTTALVHAITRAGDLLAEHFPPEPQTHPDLPDTIQHD